MRVSSLKAIIVGSIFAGVLCGSPGHAQLKPYTPAGTRIASNPKAIDPDLARKMKKDFARCIYERDADVVDRLLNSSDPKTVNFEQLGFDEADLVEKLGMSKCLSRAMTDDQLRAMMSFQIDGLRPLLAEEAYLSARREPPQIGPDDEEFLTNRVFVESGKVVQARLYGALADCIVFNAPADADRLLRTTPASDDELAAVNALVPTLGSCVTQGQEIVLMPLSVRALVADGLWSRVRFGAERVMEAAE